MLVLTSMLAPKPLGHLSLRLFPESTLTFAPVPQLPAEFALNTSDPLLPQLAKAPIHYQQLVVRAAKLPGHSLLILVSE